MVKSLASFIIYSSKAAVISVVFQYRIVSSMLIYYLQSIARSLKFTNNQLRMQLQTVSHSSIKG